MGRLLVAECGRPFPQGPYRLVRLTEVVVGGADGHPDPGRHPQVLAGEELVVGAAQGDQGLAGVPGRVLGAAEEVGRYGGAPALVGGGVEVEGAAVGLHGPDRVGAVSVPSGELLHGGADDQVAGDLGAGLGGVQLAPGGVVLAEVHQRA